MSEQVGVPPVLVAVSVIFPSGCDIAPVRCRLEKIFGSIELKSKQFPFDMTDYYENEMGPDLVRVWFCFEELRGAEKLALWKHSCVAVEDDLSVNGGRVFNLDPGYLDHGKLVLASFKEAPDKIYMGRGVWAHTCLRYRFGSFLGPDHSFPDFIDGRFNSFMKQAKSCYRRKLRERA